MSQNNGNKLAALEKRLWAAADQIWANSPLRPSKYSTPVLALIFLRFADDAFTRVETDLKGKSAGRRTIGKADYQTKGVVYVPEEARFSRLLQLLESADLGKKLNEAMKAIEKENDDLLDVLPKSCQRIDNSNLVELLKIMNNIPADLPDDAFGKVYEYFLGQLRHEGGPEGRRVLHAAAHGRSDRQRRRAFPRSAVRPNHRQRRLVVSSARFVQNHKKNPNEEISIFGQERVIETIRPCKMNLAVQGLSGDKRQYQSI